MKLLPILTASILIFATACATDPGAKIAKHQIKTVAVEPRVEAPPLRYSEVRQGTLNAALTGAILDATKSKMVKRLAAMMQQHNIDVSEIVRTNFVQAVNSYGYQYSENLPDATFVLKLEQVGFDTIGFSGRGGPFAILEGKLVKSDGKTIWSGSSKNGNDVMWGAAAPAFDKKERKNIGVKDWDEYERDPEKLRADWQAVIQYAVEDLLRAAKKAQ